MRRLTPLATYIRARAFTIGQPTEYSMLDMAFSNELQLFYLFVKWSGVTDDKV